ncbi:hypothetical protein thalar_00970 [Litoreibacter arenae DSM 19593]|uniref:Uncharacterized protein n=1 Tax=Litoreibacter arenae DSM 19593 TaxID=1123360 RepID=S9RRS7_9RHOB|nr:hypothetical protein thalar_00970 [Litoreibacter arenae DSM 19593]
MTSVLTHESIPLLVPTDTTSLSKSGKSPGRFRFQIFLRSFGARAEKQLRLTR